MNQVLQRGYSLKSIIVKNFHEYIFVFRKR
jgi:hypothetical protein